MTRDRGMKYAMGLHVTLTRPAAIYQSPFELVSRTHASASSQLQQFCIDHVITLWPSDASMFMLLHERRLSRRTLRKSLFCHG